MTVDDVQEKELDERWQESGENVIKMARDKK